MQMITMALQNGGYLTEQNSKQMELIIHNSVFSSNFCVDYEGIKDQSSRKRLIERIFTPKLGFVRQ